MGSFAQWRTAIDAGDVRRVTCAGGDQHVLIEEVVDTTRRVLNPSDLDYMSLSHGPGFDQQVWAAANQYPLTPGANRLLVVRDADKLTRWEQLEAWLKRTRQLPGVHLLFVFSNPEQFSKQNTPGYLACVRAPRGFIVRCSTLNEPDAIAWVRRRSRLDEATARYLLTRTGGNLSAAAAVCAKLALFEQGAGSATIDAIVAESPPADFTDHLIALEKRQALLSLSSLDHSTRIKMIALLDSRLDLLEKLYRLQLSGQTWREASGVNPFLMRQYQPYVRHYDADSCMKRRRVLAVLDDVLRKGADVAVMEALVALW